MTQVGEVEFVSLDKDVVPLQYMGEIGWDSLQNLSKKWTNEGKDYLMWKIKPNKYQRKSSGKESEALGCMVTYFTPWINASWI